MKCAWRAAVVIAAFAAGAALSGCPSDKPPNQPGPANAKKPATVAKSGADARGNVNVRISYSRPTMYSSGGRPEGFGVIPNYRNSETVLTYEGTWHDESQTLTAVIPLALGSEAAVYVIDNAVPLGFPTTLNVDRFPSQPIGCPPAVTTIQQCYSVTASVGR